MIPVAPERENADVRTMTSWFAELGASDGFAVAMLGVMALAMGTLAVLFFCMKRAAAKRDPHVDALLEELEEEERKAAKLARTKPAEPPAKPWERDVDWWKKH